MVGLGSFPQNTLKGVIPSPSCMFWRFYYGRILLPHVSCQSPSGAWDVTIALEGFLGTLVVIVEVCGGWGFWFGFLGGIFQMKRRRSFIWWISYFYEETFQRFFWGLLGSGVSNEILPFDEYSPEDMLSKFRGVIGRSSRMKGSDQIIYISFQKNVNTEVLLSFVLLLLDVIKYVLKECI